MLRQEDENGWWLVSHPDHARLAGDFAARWGNVLFTAPEPLESVLEGIRTHDDGWMARDAQPSITKAGKPSAFSSELVGKYSAFEEIDLEDYLQVRRDAVAVVSAKNLYAGLLVSLHTYNLLDERADRATIAPDQLPLLDNFLDEQRKWQADAVNQLRQSHQFTAADVDPETILNHFRLLQACDNLSLIACVNYPDPANLLHSLPIRDQQKSAVKVTRSADRRFRLDPYPLNASPIEFQFPARYVAGSTFGSNDELRQKFAAAEVQHLTVVIED